MKCLLPTALIIQARIAITIALFASLTFAKPIIGHFQDDDRGDPVSQQVVTVELGEAASFPAINAISYHDHRYDKPVSVADDGVLNDWTVHMTNVSGIAWKNLFFVADQGATIGNADGIMEDMLGAPGQFTDAFRIDGTITGGVNLNLLEESMIADEIFQPGESWEFAVTNFGTGRNSQPPSLTSPGVFSGSSPMVNFGTNASIVGTPVPEPDVIGLIGLVFGTTLLCRKRR